MFFEELEFYIFMIIFFIFNFVIVQAIIFFILFQAYNQGKKIKKFYGEIYQINTLHFISKKYFFHQINDFIFLYILEILIIVPIYIFLIIYYDPTLIIQFSLIFSFMFFTILIPLLIISIFFIFFYKFQKQHVSEKELLLSFQNFLKN
jgi:hypothetical protein